MAVMHVNEDLKRYLLPPIVALPVLVGFLLLLLGATGGTDPFGQSTAQEIQNLNMVYIGLAILVGNAVFWPLLFTFQGKRAREERKRRAQERAEKAREEE